MQKITSYMNGLPLTKPKRPKSAPPLDHQQKSRPTLPSDARQALHPADIDIPMLTCSHNLHTFESFPPFQPSTSGSILCTFCPVRRLSLSPTSSERSSHASITYSGSKRSESSPANPLSSCFSFRERSSSSSHRPLSPQRLPTVNEGSAATENNQIPAASQTLRVLSKAPSSQPHGFASSRPPSRRGPQPFQTTQDHLTFHHVHGLPNAHDYPYIHHPNNPRPRPQTNPHPRPLSAGQDFSGTIYYPPYRPFSPQGSPSPADTRPTSPLSKAKQPRPSIIFANTSRNSFLSRPTSPKTQFIATEERGTIARRIDSSSISVVDVKAKASGSDWGQTAGERRQTPPPNAMLRGGGEIYVYPISGVLRLRGGAGTPDPDKPDALLGDNRPLPAYLWRLGGGMGRPPTVGQWRRHKHRVKRPGGARTLGKVMGVGDWKDGNEKWALKEQKVEEKWDKRIETIKEGRQLKEQKPEERGEKKGILGGIFGKMKKGMGKAKPDEHRRAAEGDGDGVVVDV
ncbi:hypothetical protein AOQ84DRAFT_380073 [Glonium stellatum]|uniref:Uncharacterized protein n=1 Tax=Glonium stellatum TaxID=574774 RepID=A0A8E2JQ45_9PEZI|nr:hypothetical protein AOQ84DRAFT_380073 [Glonium stellatum]